MRTAAVAPRARLVRGQEDCGEGGILTASGVVWRGKAGFDAKVGRLDLGDSGGRRQSVRAHVAGSRDPEKLAALLEGARQGAAQSAVAVGEAESQRVGRRLRHAKAKSVGIGEAVVAI